MTIIQLHTMSKKENQVSGPNLYRDLIDLYRGLIVKGLPIVIGFMDRIDPQTIFLRLKPITACSFFGGGHHICIEQGFN